MEPTIKALPTRGTPSKNIYVLYNREGHMRE